ncbi:MAG: sodium:proton antiporter [Steroidobacteraceae bacterium]
MHLFETLLLLLFGATVLTAIAKRLGIPYPTVLAVGGGIAAFIPGMPRLDISPDIIMALFVAPVLLNAAFDTSLRDLRRNGVQILSLVVFAVAFTTASVALTVHLLFPEIPLAAAIALGAILAPPDAVAALAVLQQVNPPHRIRMVLEGESLLNDASALLIYRMAVGTILAGTFSVMNTVPTFLFVVGGSLVAGWLLAWPANLLMRRIDDAPSFVIVQFVITFGVWLVAERLHLSGVVTIVVFALTMARSKGPPTPPHLRVPSFAIWETVIFVLNVVAFTLIGLQMRPILDALSSAERARYVLAALIILGVVILVRLLWVMTRHGLIAVKNRVLGSAKDAHVPNPSTAKEGLVIGWSGMRGIVTLAAAMALPPGLPYRDFFLLTAFVVVLGTLVLQGMTLRPLLTLLRLPQDNTVETELLLARKTALKAALSTVEGDDSPAAQRLLLGYEEALRHARRGKHPSARPANVLRIHAVNAARTAVEELRSLDKIGDHAYHMMEEELDWLELSAGSPHQPADKE